MTKRKSKGFLKKHKGRKERRGSGWDSVRGRGGMGRSGEGRVVAEVPKSGFMESLLWTK